VVFLGLEVVLVHVDAELHLFERDVLLRLLGSFVLFALLVKELSVVLNAADRRNRGGRDLHQVETFFFGSFYGFVDRQDANLFTFGSDDADFTRPDTVIYADKTLIDWILRTFCDAEKLRGKYSMGLNRRGRRGRRGLRRKPKSSRGFARMNADEKQNLETRRARRGAKKALDY
jgi:hypothetical protein